MATLFASKSDYSSNDVVASIIAAVNEDGSNIKLSADKIELDGETIFRMLSGGNAGSMSFDNKYLVSITPELIEYKETGYTGAVSDTMQLSSKYLIFDSSSAGQPLRTELYPGSLRVYYGTDERNEPNQIAEIGSSGAYFTDTTIQGTLNLNGISLSNIEGALACGKDLRLYDGSEYGMISYVANPDHEFVFDSGITVDFDATIEGDLTINGTINTGAYSGVENAQFTTADGKLVLIKNGIIVGVTQ